MDDESWLAKLREDSNDDASRRGYADWLEARGDSRAGLLRAEDRLREAPLGDPSRRTLGEAWRAARAVQDPAWLTRIEIDAPVPSWVPLTARHPPEAGLDDWRAWASENHFGWIVLAVMAPIDAVVRTLIQCHMGVSPDVARERRWRSNVSVGQPRDYENVGGAIPFVQLQGHAWTVAMYCTFGYSSAADDTAKAHAISLSKRLGTLAVTYAAEDTSGATGYSLFELGEEVESIEEDGIEVVFGSKRRPPPEPADARDLDGDLFRALGLYLPGFYSVDQDCIRLAVPDPARCARGDTLILDRGGGEPIDWVDWPKIEVDDPGRSKAFPEIYRIHLDEDFDEYES